MQKQNKRKNKQQQNYNQKKKWNAKILITRPRVQDEQFDTILTEIITCFTLWPMHKLSRLMASIFFEMPPAPPPFKSRPPPFFTYPGSAPDCRRAKSKTSVFATDGIWVTFSVVLNFLLLDWTPWVGFQNERLMCFHNRQKRHGHSWACCYSNTICKCDGRNRLIHFFPSVAFLKMCCHSNVFNCGSIFSFLIEVCWLLYCVVYSQFEIHSLRSRTTENVFLRRTEF